MAVAILVGLGCILAGQLSVGKGLVLGALFSVVNFVLMGRLLPRQLGKSKGKTFAASFSSLSLRHFLLAVPIVVGIKFDQFNLIATVVGIFMVQIMILGDQVKALFFSPRC